MSYLGRQVLGQLGRRPVERVGVPAALAGGVPLVLEADRVHVDVPVAGVRGDVVRGDVLGDVPVSGPDGVVPGDEAVRRLDEADAVVVVALGVVHDQVVDADVVLAVGEVVVDVGLGVGRVGLHVERLDRLALDRLGALDLVHSGLQRTRGLQTGAVELGVRVCGQGDGVTEVGGLGRAAAQHVEGLSRELHHLGLVRGAGVVGDRLGPVLGALRGRVRLVRRQDGSAPADVGHRVGTDPLGGVAGQVGRERQGSGPVGSAATVPLRRVDGVVDGEVGEVHDAVPARGARRSVVLAPPRAEVAHGEKHVLGDTAHAGRTLERGLGVARPLEACGPVDGLGGGPHHCAEGGGGETDCGCGAEQPEPRGRTRRSRHFSSRDQVSGRPGVGRSAVRP